MAETSKHKDSGWAAWNSKQSGGNTGKTTATQADRINAIGKFNTPSQITRKPVSYDAKTLQDNHNKWTLKGRKGKEPTRPPRRTDIMELPDKTRFEVDRVNGRTISGYTANNKHVAIDLGKTKARVIAQSELATQDKLF